MIRRFFHGLSPVGHCCEDKLRFTWREREGKPKSSSSSKPWLGRTAAARILHRCRCWCRGPGRCTAGRRVKAGCSETSMCRQVWQTSIGCHRMSTLIERCRVFLLLADSEQNVAEVSWNQLYFGFHVLGHCGLYERNRFFWVFLLM